MLILNILTEVYHETFFNTTLVWFKKKKKSCFDVSVYVLVMRKVVNIYEN